MGQSDSQRGAVKKIKKKMFMVYIHIEVQRFNQLYNKNTGIFGCRLYKELLYIYKILKVEIATQM